MAFTVSFAFTRCKGVILRGQSPGVVSLLYTMKRSWCVTIAFSSRNTKSDRGWAKGGMGEVYNAGARSIRNRRANISPLVISYVAFCLCTISHKSTVFCPSRWDVLPIYLRELWYYSKATIYLGLVGKLNHHRDRMEPRYPSERASGVLLHLLVTNVIYSVGSCVVGAVWLCGRQGILATTFGMLSSSTHAPLCFFVPQELCSNLATLALVLLPQRLGDLLDGPRVIVEYGGVKSVVTLYAIAAWI
jgi:hypothetical protein